MKKSLSTTSPPPQCALATHSGATPPRRKKDDGFEKAYRHFLDKRGSGRTSHCGQRQRKRKDQNYSITQDWLGTAHDSSNTSWENDWIAARGNAPSKGGESAGGGFHKYRNTYQSSGSEWSPGGEPQPVTHGFGVMHSSRHSSSNSPSALSSSYYDNNDFYGYGYEQNLSGTGYQQPHPPYGGSPQYQSGVTPMRSCDGPYNGNRNPSSVPPTLAKQTVPDYHRRQARGGMDAMLRMQIKREPDADRDITGLEMEGENFTSLFTKSLTSLYSQDTENAYQDDKAYDQEVMVCNPGPHMEDGTYNRLGTSGAQYNSAGYQGTPRTSFGFYEGRTQNCEVGSNAAVEDLDSEGTSSFRYDRPSFDDMHLYASTPATDSKSQAKKRKLSMPNITSEANFMVNEKRKTPRLLSFKSDSKWTPNSFSFSDVHIKQEPVDDYQTEELDSQNRAKLPFKDSSSGSNGSTGSAKNSGQHQDHPKAVPRKRSPGATCFDRFDKKSTPTSKKVSPLSVYAKVQDSIVCSVKCRRYKKRTKPIVSKEEVVYPSREEIEKWKRTGAYSQSPDQAVRQLMSELLERVSEFGDKSLGDGPDLAQVDVMKVRELLFQFCQRYALDYRDYEDIEKILKPCIINDKTAKNSERASAIRKRTSTSPVLPIPVPEPVITSPVNKVAGSKPPIKIERGAKKAISEVAKKAIGEGAKKAISEGAKKAISEGPKKAISEGPKKAISEGPKKVINEVAKKAINEVPKPAERRVLRNLPGRTDRGRQLRRRSGKVPVVRRRYSTRSAKDVDDAMNSDVDIIIDSSTDRESEAGKEAEVRKKSERLKNKHPVKEMLAKDSSSDRAITKNSRNSKKETPRSRSKEKKEIEKAKDISKATPKKKWSRLHEIKDVEAYRSSSSEASENTKNTPVASRASPRDKTESLSLVKTPEKTGKTTKSLDETSSKTTSTRKPADKQIPAYSSLKSSLALGHARRSSSETAPSSISQGEVTLRSKADKRSVKLTKFPDVKLENFLLSEEVQKQTVLTFKDNLTCKTRPKTSDKHPCPKACETSDVASEPAQEAPVLQKITSDLKREENSSKTCYIKKTIETEIRSKAAEEAREKFELGGLAEQSETGLQVVLTKLSVEYLESKDLSVRKEFNLIAKAKDAINAAVEEKATEVDSDDNGNLRKPPELVCMKETKEQVEKGKASGEDGLSSSKNGPGSPCNLVHPDSAPELSPAPLPLAMEVNEIDTARSILPHRDSESEDSDCGLVIDLDRRLSVEEPSEPDLDKRLTVEEPSESVVLSPTFQIPIGETQQAKESDQSLDLVLKREAMSRSSPQNAFLAASANWTVTENVDEDDCILLQVTEEARSTSPGHRTETLTPTKSLTDVEAAKNMKDQDRDESILRSLLLETGDVTSGTSQDILSQQTSISADSKASISQDVMKLLMYQTYHQVSPCGLSPNFDEKKMSIDSLTTDENANLLSDNEDFIRDPRLIKEKIKKLKNEIVYLQCMADQKDKERTAIVCFKRYKEEVLRRLIKEYAFNVQDHVRDWIRARQENSSSESRSSSGRQQSVASTSASTSQQSLPQEASHSRVSPSHQVIQLAYHATVKTDVPAATVTSASRKSSPHCGEKLPTVATMIAKATENYGVDMRTMRNGTSTTQTILQKVLSSKESIYSPTTCRSPSSEHRSTKSSSHHHQHSVHIFQKTMSSSKETSFSPTHARSPSLPELRPAGKPAHQQLLQKVLSSKDISYSSSSSRSPPSLQPELRTPLVKPFSTLPSNVQKNYPLDLIVVSSEGKAEFQSKSSESTSSKSAATEAPKNNTTISSPKRSPGQSCSVWSSVQPGKSVTATSIDLRTDHSRTQESILTKRSTLSGSRSGGGQGFMVVPPPITLQQSQKSALAVSHQSKTDVTHERSLKSSVERIYSRKTEEERRALTYSSLISSSSSASYSGHIVRGSVPSSTISTPPQASTPSNGTPRCMGCGLSDAKFLCSGCRKHWYCSAQCQTMRWPEHSRVCAGNLYSPSAGPSYP